MFIVFAIIIYKHLTDGWAVWSSVVDNLMFIQWFDSYISDQPKNLSDIKFKKIES